MAKLILLNKPFRVMCQFSDSENRKTLADYVKTPKVYPAGRLDYDSEGLVVLTDDGQLQHQISDPRHKLRKCYWVQLEGQITEQELKRLANGIELKDGLTKPAQVKTIEPPTQLWPRVPAIRQRKDQPTSWIELAISEGKNRQIRRMTAAVGYPTLRLIRHSIGNWSLGDLQPGQYSQDIVHTMQGDEKNRKTFKLTKTK